MSRPKSFAVITIVLSLMSGPAAAATLTVLQGNVLVNRGTGYQLVSGASEVAPGDQVFADPDGQAMLAYPDGTSTVVEPGNVVSVTESGAAPVAAGALNTSTLIIGGAVVAGGVGLALGASGGGGGGKDHPASP